MGAPCDWDISESLTCCPNWATYSPVVQAAATSFATEVLWALSGRQFGKCPKTIRPCTAWVGQTYRTYGVWLDGYANGAVSPAWWPYIDQGGVWRNACGCNGVCCCEPSQQVWIPGPSPSITSVTVNNVLVPAANYRLELANGLFWLVGQNGQQWPECFPGDTLILTEDGLIPIADVREGQRVLTHQNRWRKVTSVRQSGIKKTVRVHGQGGPLSSTADHKIYARKTSTNITNGTTSRRYRSLGDVEWKEAADLVGYTRATPAVVEPLPVVLPDGWLPEYLPDNFWWFVGRWVGDGWTDPGSNRVVLCCGAHEVAEVRAELKGTGWGWSETADKKSGYTDVPRFRFTNKALYQWLRENFGTLADTKKVPAWLLGASGSIREQFLAGYVSADGWVGPQDGRGRPYTSVHTVSRALAVGIRLLATGLGHAPTIYEGSAGGPHRSTTFKMNWPQARSGEPYSQTELEDGHLWGRVRRVDLSDIAVPVYDLEVEEDHSFIADGFVVHNCQNFDVPASSTDNTFVVVLGDGIEVPATGLLMAALMACEYAKMCTGLECALSAAATAVTRDGVSYEILSPSDLISKGYTPMPVVNQWIYSVNPRLLPERPRVWSPDDDMPRITV